MSVNHRQDARVRAGGVKGELIAEAAVGLRVHAVGLELLDDHILPIRTDRFPHARLGGGGDLTDHRETPEAHWLDHALRVTRTPDAM